MRTRLRLAVLAAALVASAAAAEGYEGENMFSTSGQREEWRTQLSLEAGGRPVATVFHPLGHLTAINGPFDLRYGDVSELKRWLLRHAAMLGLPAEAKLELSGEQEYLLVNEDGKPDRAGSQLSFRVYVDGYPFVGQELSVIVMSAERPVLVGVLNHFGPALRGLAGSSEPGTEESAWQAAEAAAQSRLTPVSAAETWWDPSWASARIPGTKELYWRLVGEDDVGVVRYIYVRKSDNAIGFASTGDVNFTWPVPHTHYGYDKPGNYGSAGIFWDWNGGNNAGTSCTFGVGSCKDPAWTESRTTKANFPATQELWNTISAPGNSASYGVWPWPAGPMTPIYIRQSKTEVVAAHGENLTFDKCGGFGACRAQGTFYFPKDEAGIDVVGHEWGHAILDESGKAFVGTYSAAYKHQNFLTESLCDVLGTVTEDVTLKNSGSSARTDFQILPAKSYGQDWPNDPSSCSNPRARLGRAYWDFFQRFEADPNFSWWSRDQRFEQWYATVLRAIKDLPDQPDAADLFAVALFRIGIGINKPAFGPADPIELHFYQALFAHIHSQPGWVTGCR